MFCIMSEPALPDITPAVAFTLVSDGVCQLNLQSFQPSGPSFRLQNDLYKRLQHACARLVLNSKQLLGVRWLV